MAIDDINPATYVILAALSTDFAFPILSFGIKSYSLINLSPLFVASLSIGIVINAKRVVAEKRINPKFARPAKSISNPMKIKTIPKLLPIFTTGTIAFLNFLVHHFLNLEMQLFLLKILEVV